MSRQSYVAAKNRIKACILSMPGFSHIYRTGYKEGYDKAVSKLNERFGRPILESLHHKHKGERGFVIGNGPSLRTSDLSRLTGEVTVASNKIFLAFTESEWRPTYATICDNLVWKKIRHIAHEYYSTVYHPSNLDPSDCHVNCVAYRYLGNAALLGSGYRPYAFSDNLAVGAYGGYTVTFDNLQFATHLGLNPIYLIGCDHYYEGELNITPGKPINSLMRNHFSPAYRTPGEKVNPAPVKLMTEAYRVAARYAEHAGIQILNATRGGNLDVFPRVDFDDILKI